MKPQAAFPLVDRYMEIRLDADLSKLQPGKTLVVESTRRLRRELSFGYIHALWWLWLDDGRSVVSVPLGAGDAVGKIVAGVTRAELLHEQALADELKPCLDHALTSHGLPGTNRVFSGLCFACNGASLRVHRSGRCERLIDTRIPAAEGIRLPDHCFPDGVAYGVVVEDKAVSIAHAHKTGLMEDTVADLGVTTALPWRGQGFAKTAVSHVVLHLAQHGGEAFYETSPDNKASIAVARSCGFAPYGNRLILSVPSKDV